MSVPMRRGGGTLEAPKPISPQSLPKAVGMEDFSIPGCFENFFLTFVLGCAKFGGVTGCEEDMHPLGNAQRRAGWCEAPQLPLDDTTSEP